MIYCSELGNKEATVLYVG